MVAYFFKKIDFLRHIEQFPIILNYSRIRHAIMSIYIKKIVKKRVYMLDA